MTVTEFCETALVLGRAVTGCASSSPTTVTSPAPTPGLTCANVRCAEQCVMEYAPEESMFQPQCVPLRTAGQVCGSTMVGDQGRCAEGLSCLCVGNCANPQIADAPKTCVENNTSEDLTCANVRCAEQCVMQFSPVNGGLEPQCISMRTLNQGCGPSMLGDLGRCAEGLTCACKGDCVDPLVADATSQCVEIATTPLPDLSCANVRCVDQCVMQYSEETEGLSPVCVPFRTVNQACGETVGGDLGRCGNNLTCACIGDCANPQIADAPKTCVEPSEIQCCEALTASCTSSFSSPHPNLSDLISHFFWGPGMACSANMTIESFCTMLAGDERWVQGCPTPACERGEETASCFAPPCNSATCPMTPDAICVDNYCGGCHALWYSTDGRKVQCATGRTTTKASSTDSNRSQISGSPTAEPNTSAAPCVCPEIYAPVCANNKTYASGCEAACHGKDSFSTGACETKASASSKVPAISGATIAVTTVLVIAFVVIAISVKKGTESTASRLNFSNPTYAQPAPAQPPQKDAPPLYEAATPQDEYLSICTIDVVGTEVEV